MGQTEYARPHLLRLTADERAILAMLVMREIEDVTHRPDADQLVTGVRSLRSLLERLTN